MKKDFIQPKKFTIVDRIPLYSGYFSLEKISFRFEKYEGGMSGVVEREFFNRKNAVAILLYDPDLQQVVLVEQFRVGLIDDTTASPWHLECVAGMLDSDLDPENTAIKEAKEETGAEIKKCFPIGQFWVSPGVSNEKVFAFVGIVDSKNINGIHGNSEEHENIRVVVWPLEKAFAAIDSGKISNAYTIILLQWLKLNQKNNFFF